MRRPVVLFLLLILAATSALAAGPEYIPIVAARQQAIGTSVTVLALVTVASGDFSSSSGDEGFAIQDQTGGIWVSVPKNLHLRVGQRVLVTGTIQNAGRLQIVPTDTSAVKRLAGSELLVATGQVKGAVMGYLITVEGTIQQLQDDGSDGFKVWIDDGSGQLLVYLNKSTDINPHAPYLKVGRRIRVTGFANQYNDAYELDPRSKKDLKPLP